jgi:hypothetical protein
MQYTIRPYAKADYTEIKKWWDASNEMAPIPEMLPEESTLILELDKTPALMITVYLTNCKEVSYLENFAGNPELKGESRKQAAQYIVDAACGFAKGLGYKRVLCLSYKDKLKERYQELGMTPTVDNLMSLVREL